MFCSVSIYVSTTKPITNAERGKIYSKVSSLLSIATYAPAEYVLPECRGWFKRNAFDYMHLVAFMQMCWLFDLAGILTIVMF